MCLVMEHVEGETLRTLLKRAKQPQPSLSLEIARGEYAEEPQRDRPAGPGRLPLVRGPVHAERGAVLRVGSGAAVSRMVTVRS